MSVSGGERRTLSSVGHQRARQQRNNTARVASRGSTHEHSGGHCRHAQAQCWRAARAATLTTTTTTATMTVDNDAAPPWNLVVDELEAAGVAFDLGVALARRVERALSLAREVRAAHDLDRPVWMPNAARRE